MAVAREEVQTRADRLFWIGYLAYQRAAPWPYLDSLALCVRGDLY
jgi:hypothetical protein